MSFRIILSDGLEKTLHTLNKKDHVMFMALQKKILQIADSSEESMAHFKNLRGRMSHLKRAHVGSFVLLFKVKKDSVVFESFLHHDEAYE